MRETTKTNANYRSEVQRNVLMMCIYTQTHTDLDAVFGVHVNRVKPLVDFDAHQHVGFSGRGGQDAVFRERLDDGLGGEHVQA